jgi:hypothetical protein
LLFIDIGGRHKNKAVVEWYCYSLAKELKIHRLGRELNIRFTSKELEDGAQGLALGDKNEVTLTIATKEYTFLEQMMTLAHEFVHAKQYFRKELTSEGGFAWKGRSADNFQYDNQPWEREAFRLEKELFLSCFPFDKELK